MPRLVKKILKPTQITGKELDFVNHEAKVAFEYCGLYWHTDKSKEIRNSRYHYDKYAKCLDVGYRLFTIWSSEWLYRPEQVKSYIQSALGKNSTTYFARKCIIKSVDKIVGKTFIDRYHIQGQKRTGIYYVGCYHNDILVGCISLNWHHRKTTELILDRMVFLPDITVVGGASKMLKSCIDWAKKQGYKKITTWSDNRWSQGNVYKKMGFDLDTNLKPDYAYVDLKNPRKIIPKQSMRNKDDSNLAKIWDCGKKRWVLNFLLNL